jgi:membrane protein YqaA with SNARE-associated domain
MHDLLQRFVDFLQPLALQLGGPGLAIIAFFDSSFLSLPEVSDVLIVVLTIQHPARWLYYAAMTTLGSICGCYALYALARKGGEAALRRRFHERHIDRGLAIFRKYGLLAVIVPSILPPPTPFKIFVLLAGVSGVRPLTFLVAVIIGRGFRYGSEALLAYWYGERATQFIQDNLPIVSVWVAVVIFVIGVIYFLRRRRRTPASA